MFRNLIWVSLLVFVVCTEPTEIVPDFIDFSVRVVKLQTGEPIPDVLATLRTFDRNGDDVFYAQNTDQNGETVFGNVNANYNCGLQCFIMDDLKRPVHDDPVTFMINPGDFYNKVFVHKLDTTKFMQF